MGEFPGEDMAISIAPRERPDPISSNLRGFLLLFFVMQCVVLPYYLYGIFDGVRITPEVLDRHPYAVAYNRFELLLGVSIFIATVIGLFLVIVRDPRSIAWWKTLSLLSLVISVAQVWLVRGLPPLQISEFAMTQVRKARSTLAAKKKSDSVRPSILCVQISTPQRPQPTWRSGWCACCSAISPTRFANASACAKSRNSNVRSKCPDAVNDHPVSSCASSASIRSRGSGGTPPRHGIHC